MSAYETMIVISTKLDEEETAALLKRFTDLISENGNIVAVDEWGKRRLAYEIQKETEGYYTLVTFESNPEFIMELERIYRITDGLLRTLVIRKDHPTPSGVIPEADFEDISEFDSDEDVEYKTNESTQDSEQEGEPLVEIEIEEELEIEAEPEIESASEIEAEAEAEVEAEADSE